MRATIEGIEIEGTPEEIAQFLATIRGVKPRPFTSSDDETIVEVDEDRITEQFAYRTLRRIPLSTAQNKLLRALKTAHPKWLRSSELQKALDWSPTQLGGVFGGLGRRVSATKGHKAGFNLWEWTWDVDEGEYAYRLPEAVLAALARAGL